MDTIFAASSGSPPAAIAIVRLSGPDAFAAARVLAGALPEARKAGLRALRDPADGRLLDRALVLVFPAPRTATGEDVVELHVHGGRAVVAAVEGALAAQPRLRRAEPGEFTRRALTNGVIDLSEAEGLGDLLCAETESQRRAALLIAEGGLRAKVEDWGERLVTIAAQVEAQLDFTDEDDVGEAALETVVTPLATIAEEIEALLAAPPVERFKDGLRIVLAGPPNSGKSTLLNAMVGREVAIVSPIAGTTRDRIEVPVVRNGVAYVLTDTAGLHDESDDPVEQIGIDRARRAIHTADIVVWLGDDQPAPEGSLKVHARADLPERTAAPVGAIAVSARTGQGLPVLWGAIAAEASLVLPLDPGLLINLRQRDVLSTCRTALATALGYRDFLTIAEEVRQALYSLDRITGRAGIEQVLDGIFSRFCIGK